jgi:hypothetical protein
MLVLRTFLEQIYENSTTQDKKHPCCKDPTLGWSNEERIGHGGDIVTRRQSIYVCGSAYWLTPAALIWSTDLEAHFAP